MAGIIEPLSLVYFISKSSGFNSGMPFITIYPIIDNITPTVIKIAKYVKNLYMAEHILPLFIALSFVLFMV